MSCTLAAVEQHVVKLIEERPAAPRAGWGARAIAAAIDTALVWSPAFWLLGTYLNPGPEPEDPFQQGFFFPMLWFILVGLPYYVGLRVRRLGRTLGERIAGVRVRDSEGGEKLSVRAAATRTISSGLLLWSSIGIAFLLSCLRGARNPSRQTWHDAWAHAVVIRAGRRREGS